MNSNLVLAVAFACLAGVAATSRAQTAPLVADSPPERGEPNVKHTVIEDKGSKIDELKVRGQTQRVVVTPKVGITRPYEILVAPAGRDPFDGTGGARTAAGKRVWTIGNF
jgi:hypothetical protein